MKKLGKKGNEQPYLSKDLMKSIYQCRLCNYPTLMFGCDNPNCENYYLRNMQKDYLRKNESEEE